MAQSGHIVTGETYFDWPSKTDATGWQSIARIPVLPPDPNHNISTSTAAVHIGKFTIDGSQWSGIPDNAVINYVRQRITFIGIQITKYPAMQIELAVSGVSVASSGELNAYKTAPAIGYIDFDTPGFTVAQAKAGLVEVWLTAYGANNPPVKPFQYE